MEHLAGPSLAAYPDRTLTALLLSAVERFRARPALGLAATAERLTYGDVEDRVARMAAFLTAQGVAAGDRVAILSENRPEWAVLDFAILSLGAVTVPVYPTLPAGQVAEILEDAGARLVFVSTREQAAKVAGLEAPVFTFDAMPALSQARSIEAWRAHARSVGPDDVATIIYTSGTTGTPKGVVLSHGNLAAMVAATRQHGSLDAVPGDVALSILPLSHVFERAADYYFFAHGTTILYAESMQTVARDMLAVRPHHVVAVPRLFEKVYDAVLQSPGAKGRIARWAAGVAVAYVDRVTHGQMPSPALRARRAIADRLVYRVLRARIGGRLRTFICGGAPLHARVGALFHAAGMPVYEGYGLTETSPVISANRPGAIRLGSAGVPYPGVEVRLGAEREIQVRGPGVTRGYWKRAEDSAAAFTADGWFRTGDVGAIEDGFLHVVDRLKDLIVTAGGKKVAPQPIEQRLTALPSVGQAVLLGDRRPYLVLLVVPEAGGPGTGAEREARVAAEVAAELHDVARFERPKRVALVPDELTVERGLLTPTLKVRRRAVERAYAALLDAIYAGTAGTAVEESAPAEAVPAESR